MKKNYYIRSGSIAEFMLNISPFVLFILVASVCAALTGTH